MCHICALDEFRIGRDDVAVTRVNLDGWHAIRVRNYEPDLCEVRVAPCGSAAWRGRIMCGWYDRI